MVKNNSVTLTDEELRTLCFDYLYYANRYPDLKAVFGYDEALLYQHWITWGQKEGRASSPLWDPVFYVKNNDDIQKVVGNDYAAALKHFRMYGYAEYRKTSDFYDGKYYQKKYWSEFKDMTSKELLFHMRNYGLKEGRWANNAKYKGISSWR